MVDREEIEQAVQEAIKESGIEGLFLVEVRVHGDEVEVFVDSDATDADGRPEGVGIDDCVSLARAIEGRFDTDEEDFALTVSSAGIGQPLRVARQYCKLTGGAIEVVLTTGTKLTATLEGIETDGDDVTAITLSWPERQRDPGQKRPRIVTVTKTFSLAEIKSTAEHIDFK